MITTLSQAPDSIVLEPGQSLRTSVEAGAWLQLAEGRARVVSPPGWFGETVFMTETLLDEGDVHRLPQGGWIEVAALSLCTCGCMRRWVCVLGLLLLKRRGL
jgi:hypothetical protein